MTATPNIKNAPLFAFDSVRTRFLAPTIALLVVLLGALGVVLVNQNTNFARQMMSNRAESMVDFLGKVGQGQINYYNLQEIDNLVDQATKDPDIRWVAFFDDKQKLLAQKQAYPAEPKDTAEESMRLTRTFKDADGKELGSLVVIYSTRSVNDNAQRSILYVIGGVAITLLLFVIGMLIVTSSVLRPVHELTRITKAVVDTGDLRQTIEVRSRDEIGQLANSFQDMVVKMREALGSLQSSSQALDYSVSNLTVATEQQSQTLTKQAASLQETQVTAQEIKQTSAVAAEKADSVLRVMDRADEISRRGEEAVEQSVVGLREMQEQVSAIANKINELSGRAQQIADITATVKDLADQSNMLALNAAIEAARSGEHGKGFAVVAREIRSLANQSVQATTRVRDILADITGAIREAVSISQTGIQRIEAGLVQVNSSGESVRQLSAIVKENSGAARQIASAVNQQNAGIAQIFTALTDLSTMMDDSLKRLESTTTASNAIAAVSKRAAEVVKAYSV